MTLGKRKDLYMILLFKQFENIDFLINKMMENHFQVLGHQMGKPACHTTSHTGLFGHLMLPISNLKLKTGMNQITFDRSVFA